MTGPVEVRFSGGGLATTMGVAVSLAGKNVKVDLVDGNTIQSNVTAELTQSSVNLTLLGIENVNGSGNGLANTNTGNKGKGDGFRHQRQRYSHARQNVVFDVRLSAINKIKHGIPQITSVLA